MTIDVNVKSAKGGYVDAVASGGAVSSVDATGCTGLSVTGGPITTSGTFVFTLGSELQALSALSTTGFISRTGVDTYSLGSITATGSTGLTISGSPLSSPGTLTFTLGTELQALSGLSSTGLVTRTAANTYVERSIAIGSANLTISNGSGVSGNPTIDLATTLSGLSLITTDSITINNSPVSPTDGSNKAYVDLVAAGFQFKSSCYCATTANLSATYSNGLGGVGATLTNTGTLAAISIDGQSPALNARVLVKDQTTTYQNGIYTVTTVGSGAVAWVLTRASDFDQPIEIHPGDLIPVQNGTINLDTVWLETSTVTIVGTDAIIFTQFLYSPNYFLKVSSNLSDVASASTSRSNLGLTNVAIQSVTNHSALVGGASNAITSIALTNGQLLIGSTSADPVAATPTNGTNISWTTGSGSLTANISGQIALTNGGTNASLSASNGGIFYSTASAGAILSGTATANQVLLSGASTTPAWSTATYPATTTINQLLYSSSANTIGEITTANNGTLITSSGGVPSISSTLPSTVQGNITSVGTISSGTWNGSIIDLSHGGTNANLTASNGGILYSTASAAAILAGTATANKILLSGSSTTPSWSTSTIPSSAGSTANVLLISNGTNYVLGALTYPNSATLGDTYYASSTSAIGTLAGNTTSTKKFLTQTGAAGVSAAPVWNTIVAADVPASNLTKVDDTNVTITIGTAACLLAASSLTMGWSGQLSLARGGTNANLTASNGGIFYSTASAGAILSATATANQMLLSGASGAPAWSTVTHPATTTINQILYSSAANVISGLATGNSGTLITSSGGVPSISSTLPSTVQGNITSTGTITSGTWNGSNVDLSHGGTNANLTASNGGIFYSTASAGAILSGTATANQILLSGSSTTPAWSTATYPATTTINQILYSSAANTVAGLATGNNGVLITSATGVPSLLPNGTSSQVLIATTGSPPSWSNLSAIGVTSITGTSNQVLANSTSGSAQIGAVTLTLPQSIATSSAVQFGSMGINTAANVLTAQLIVSSAAPFNIALQGTQTDGAAACIDIESTLNPSSVLSANVKGIRLLPTITVSSSATPAISTAYGYYVYLTVNGTGGKILTNCCGVFTDSGSLATATVTNSYGGYFTNPGFGTNKCALYGDNGSIGYTATTPPTNGLIVSGNVSIGSSSATSLFNVGSSNQFQIGTTGIVTSGTWQATAVGVIYGGTGLTSTVANQILYSSATSTIAGLATGNNGTLITSSGGVPSISSTLPNAVQLNITSTGTITAGTWNGTTITVDHGGTGVTSTTAYAVLCGGTTSTGALQSVSGVGSSGNVLKSNGAAALPTWVDLATLGVSSLTGTANQVLVNATTGSAQIGDLTLTLPQSIATSSTVQFGSIGINVAAAATVQLNVSSSLAFNTFLRGTQTAQNSNLQCALVIQQTFAPTARITGRVAAIFNNPTITVPNVNNPAIAAAIGEYVKIAVNGTAGKVLTDCAGVFVDSGSLATATVTNSYGGYFTNPGFGTNVCSLYADDSSIGYTGTAPPSNGLIVSGNVGIGNSSPTTALDVTGNARRRGNITVSETITAAGALSTTLDSILDSRTGTFIATLAAASFVDQVKVVRLLTRFSDYATVSCPMGSFNLTASEPTRILRYVDNGTNDYWACESGYSPYTPDSFYVTTQQGSKLVGTGATGTISVQGAAVSLSSDGNTLAVGGYNDNSGAGAVWIWVRSSGSWTQQGSKLVGTGATGAAAQGAAVSLSADGNTLAVGGRADNTNAGAVWVWTRSGTTWTQQGSKLVGTGATGAAKQSYSISLSADGNTLAVGGNSDNSSVGATWIWTRSGTTWTQQGSKLVGTGTTGGTNQQGISVSLSADGNTVAVGGYGDNSGAGAVWVWTRSGTTWTQQGSKLVGTGATGTASQGSSVSLSADGNTLAIGGYQDNSFVGASWVWTRSVGVWTQQVSSPLIGTSATGASKQGFSVSLSSDGNSLSVGGYDDNSSAGAVWQFVRSGDNWTQQGSKLVGTGATGAAQQGYSVSLCSYGNTLAVGGLEDNSNAGAVWIWI